MKFKLSNYNRNISDNDLLDDLKRVVKLLNKRSVTMYEYMQHGKYSYGTFRYHFGIWGAALKKAGLPLNRQYRVTKAELLFNMKRVWLKLGRQPKCRDMNKDISDYSWYSYRKKFGSFRNALVEFVKHATKRRNLTLRNVIHNNTGKKRKKNRTKRHINHTVRYKVLTRDNYTCVKCGSSPATEKGVKLEIDHIKPYSKGGETVLSNLQTLCRACNVGKGNK